MFWAAAVSAPCLPAEVSITRVTCHNTAGATRDQQRGVFIFYLFILLQTWESAKCYVLLNVGEGTNKSTDKLFLFRHQYWLRVPEPACVQQIKMYYCLGCRGQQ